METPIAAMFWLIFVDACIAVICVVMFITLVWYNLWKELRSEDKKPLSRKDSE